MFGPVDELLLKWMFHRECSLGDGHYIERDIPALVKCLLWYWVVRGRNREPAAERSSWKAQRQESAQVVQGEAQEWLESIIINISVEQYYPVIQT